MAYRPLSPHQTAPQGRTRLSQHCPDSCAPPFERRQVHLPDASLDTALTRESLTVPGSCARVAGVRGRLRHASRVCNVGPPDAGRCASSGASRRPAVPAHLHPRRALSSELPLGGWVGASPAPGDERLGYLGATLVRLASWRMQPVRDSCQAIAIWYLVQNGPLNRVT